MTRHTRANFLSLWSGGTYDSRGERDILECQGFGMSRNRTSERGTAMQMPALCRVAGMALLGLAALLPCEIAAQRQPLDSSPSSATTVPRRFRLIMRDGSYQLVLSYTVQGKIVHYTSAERDGETEDVPLALVDIPATETWQREHFTSAPSSQRPDVLSPELAKEEAERSARMPEIFPGLRLPEEDSVLVLDTFQGTPELIPLAQQGGDLNKETAHNVLKQAINPSSAPHRILDVRGQSADIQVHVADPVFYVRVGADDEGDAGAGAITVDTHGASGREAPAGGDAANGYVLERLVVLSDGRVVESFRLGLLGVKKQPDVIEMKADDLPGGHWMKLTPVQPMEFGEYALMEVLSDREVNLGVWDFGVHPDAKEDAEAIRPVEQRPATLERRRPE
jgi:hypothetical protein